jgi:AraC-like DNA-binding protein
MARMSTLLSEIDLIGMQPARVSAGEVTYPPGGRLGPRWQHDVELVLVHSGSARITVDDDAPFALHQGSVALLLPGHREYFEFDARTDTHHSWVQLGVTGTVPAEIASAPRVLPASTALTELVRASALPATADALAASLAAAAIWRYVGDARSPGDAPADAVELARRHLDRHLADVELSLDGLASTALVTPAHLVRRFRAELGVTPMAYLWERRVAVAVDLLQSTGLPIKEVALRTGFRSVYHFSRRVKAHAGVPPTEVRARQSSSSADASRSVAAPSRSVTRT